MTAKKVLVTGGSGFVGQAVVAELAAHGHRVIATYRTAAPAIAVEWIQWDRKLAQLPAVDFHEVGTILHLATPLALARDPFSSPMYQAAVGATFDLLETGARFILASTGDALGSRPGGPALESDLHYAPANFYGTAKACAELLCRARPNSTILRFFHPYGPGGKSLLINRLLRKVHAGEQIRIEGEHGVRLNPVWIGDLARGVRLALESSETGVFHFAGNETESLRELLHRMGRIAAREARIQRVDAEPVECHCGDFARSSAVLGYRPEVSLDDGLTRLTNVK